MELDREKLKDDLVNLTLPEIFQVLEIACRTENDYYKATLNNPFFLTEKEEHKRRVYQRRAFFHDLRVEIEDHIIWLYQVRAEAVEEDHCVSGTLQDV